MNWLVTFFLNQSVSLAVSLVGLLFFGGLTVSGLLGSQKRAYLPALVVIDLAIVSSLVRVLFFWHLSPDPGAPGGWWRLITAAVLIWGFVLFERAVRKERRNGKRGRSDASV